MSENTTINRPEAESTAPAEAVTQQPKIIKAHTLAKICTERQGQGAEDIPDRITIRVIQPAYLAGKPRKRAGLDLSITGCGGSVGHRWKTEEYVPLDREQLTQLGNALIEAARRM